MKEIGGYFEFENIYKEEYYKDLLKLNTARNALLYLTKARNIRKIYIPYYLCDSVSNMLTLNNISYEYYNIDINFNPIIKKEIKKDEFLYIVNYYGLLDDELIINLKKKYKNVILDNVHAFFQKPLNQIDTIYSCRKFFGVPDGAYLSTNVKLKKNIEIDKSKDRFNHLLGRFEENANDYYKDFKNNEKNFLDLPLKYMSKLTQNILGAIDYKKIIKKRNENFSYLHKILKPINQLNLIMPNGPYAYPLYLKNGNEIRKKLIKDKIYVPILWPNVLKNVDINSFEYNLALNILPLPIDQRYNIEDMKIILKELDKCLN